MVAEFQMIFIFTFKNVLSIGTGAWTMLWIIGQYSVMGIFDYLVESISFFSSKVCACIK